MFFLTGPSGCARKYIFFAFAVSTLLGLIHAPISLADEMDDVSSDFEEYDVEDTMPMHDMSGQSDGENDSDFESPVTAKTAALSSVPFVMPSLTNLDFAELFDTHWEDRWVKSIKEKYTGVWERALPRVIAIEGDHGLKVTEKLKHFGISTRLPLFDMSEPKDFAASYEAKFENGLNCGGAYLKFFDSKGIDLSNFDNEIPYSIMFGPDKCGPTNKVHFIIRSQNPVTLEWTEHHLTNPPRLPNDSATHLYSFRISPDDTYDVLIDNESRKSGDIKTDFSPSFSTPLEISDPSDEQPADWDDNASIPDPTSIKPDDWDETAPRKIPDVNAVMPEGWLEDEPSMITTEDEVDLQMPEDWDEEENGKWSPPQIPNPICSIGCGKWTPNLIDNPAFRGPFHPELMANPNYQGIWEARKIPNPSYYENKHPSRLSMNIDAVGFELWTTDSDILFDNIVVTRDWKALQGFISETFLVKQKIEKANIATTLEGIDEDDHSSGLDRFVRLAKQNIYVAALAGIMSSMILYFIISRLRRSAAKDADKVTTDTKKTDIAAISTESSEDDTAIKAAAQTRKRVTKPVVAAD